MKKLTILAASVALLGLSVGAFASTTHQPGVFYGYTTGSKTALYNPNPTVDLTSANNSNQTVTAAVEQPNGQWVSLPIQAKALDPNHCVGHLDAWINNPGNFPFKILDSNNNVIFSSAGVGPNSVFNITTDQNGNAVVTQIA